MNGRLRHLLLVACALSFVAVRPTARPAVTRLHQLLGGHRRRGDPGDTDDVGLPQPDVAGAAGQTDACPRPRRTAGIERGRVDADGNAYRRNTWLPPRRRSTRRPHRGSCGANVRPMIRPGRGLASSRPASWGASVRNCSSTTRSPKKAPSNRGPPSTRISRLARTCSTAPRMARAETPRRLAHSRESPPTSGPAACGAVSRPRPSSR